MPANLPAQPLLTPVIQPAPTGPTGAGPDQQGLLSRIWSQWLNVLASVLTQLGTTVETLTSDLTLLTARVSTLETTCPQVVTIAQQSGLTADIASTALYAVPATVTNGLYRITVHNDLNLAGGKCTASITYTCDGTLRTHDGTQVTSVTDPVSWTYLFDPDAGTTVSYYTTCVIPGGGIDYDIDLVLERIPT